MLLCAYVLSFDVIPKMFFFGAIFVMIIYNAFPLIIMTDFIDCSFKCRYFFRYHPA
jgi:hypothetical protein